MTTSPKVLLVDDHELVRVGVKSACAELRGIAVQWLEADTLEDGMRVFAAEPGIDLVLLDLNLADSKGLQGLRLFLQAHPKARVAVFSATQDEFVVRQARALGAVGYVSKGSNASQLHDALVATLLQPARSSEGRLPPIGTASFPRLPATAIYDRVAELGPRHLEILELVLSGCTNQEISTVTKLSLGTVKNYVSSLLLALDVRSRSHLISLFR
jgi:NarL family two-component system response regulator LiaR